MLSRIPVGGWKVRTLLQLELPGKGRWEAFQVREATPTRTQQACAPVLLAGPRGEGDG